MTDPDWGDGPLDARKARLIDVLDDAGTEHTIKVERLPDPDHGVVYPRLIDAIGRCPPEDIGGPWGYAEFLDAIRDPKHERHVELKEWIAYDFDPKIVDTEGLAEEVAALAKRWSRSPTTRRTRRG